MNSPSRARLIAGFATIYLVWGSTYLGIRFAIETLPPFLMAGGRFVVAGAVLYVWARARGAARPTRAHWASATVVGLFLLLGGNGVVAWAEQRVASGVAALIVAMVPCWLVLLDWLRPGGTRPGAAVVGGLGFGLLGIGILAGPDVLMVGNPIDPVGVVALLAASLFWAAGSIYSRSAASPPSNLLGSAMQMLAGGVGLFLAGAVTGEFARLDASAVSARSALAVLYLIVFGSLVGYTTYTWLLRVSTPARVGTYAYVNPVVAVLLGWALAGEALSARIALASAVIVTGVALITWRKRTAAPAPPDACAPPPASPTNGRRHGRVRRALRIGRRAAATSFALLLLGCGSSARRTEPATALRAGDHEITLQHDGRARIALVHVPRTGSTPRPLLLALHGGGGEAAAFRDYAGLDALADREDFIVVYPYGTGALERRLLTWNAGTGCCGYAREREVDDVGFLLALVDEIAHRTSIDTNRVYATGHSNGAMMAYRLAAERADRIAAIAPVAGAMDLARFSPSRAVPVLHIHSVDDPRALYEGGVGPPFPFTNQRVRHRSVREALALWAQHDGCAANPTEVERRSGQPGAPDASHTATLLSWGPCSGAEVRHWRLTGAGHGWPGDSGSRRRDAIIGPPTSVVNAAEEVWAFVSAFARE